VFGLWGRFCLHVFPEVNTPSEGGVPFHYRTWDRHRNDCNAEGFRAPALRRRAGLDAGPAFAAASLSVGADGFWTIVGVRCAMNLRAPSASLAFFVAMRQLYRIGKGRGVK